MPVEVALLAAVDRAIHCLEDLLRRLFPQEVRTIEGFPIRELLVFLLALRHEYLDEHVYSACEKMEAKVLDKVRCVVSSVSTLLKANGCASSWSAFLRKTRKLLLILDEINSTAFEEATGAMTKFDLVVCGLSLIHI